MVVIQFSNCPISFIFFNAPFLNLKGERIVASAVRMSWPEVKRKVRLAESVEPAG